MSVGAKSPETKRIVLVAAENGALPGGKVGGIGDVVRDLPVALADLGWDTTVVSPEYGIFSRLPGARSVGHLNVFFAGADLDMQVVDVPGPDTRVRHVALQHDGFAPSIYSDDSRDRPFARDATKFALFCAAVATYVRQLSALPDVVHLHDWHTALYCFLTHFDPSFHQLRQVRTVYTIHNLALQGTRPLDHDESSLAAWFHDLPYSSDSVIDPAYRNCVNPMALGIRLADRVNTVSPTYAREILRPNEPDRGFRGGEGLERDLQQKSETGSVVGILNGCPYPRDRQRRKPGWRRFRDSLVAEVTQWQEQNDSDCDMHDIAIDRLLGLPKQRPIHLLTSIGRLTDQKAALFLQQTSKGVSALERILSDLDASGLFILLGSGEAAIERKLLNIAKHHQRLIFLCGYADRAADLLYRAGDLFLMPSSFEPCGISQMLAMRDSQPCVVHAVGGLSDTVKDNVNGFCFSGENSMDQADQFVATVHRALTIKSQQTDRWLAIRHRASAERFSWQTTAARYIETLYD